MAWHTLNWSTLGRLAMSPAGKLTMLAPFIGQYLVLNDRVFDSLAFVDDTLGTINLGWFSLNIRQSLIFTYLGLFAFGVGSILVTVFRPSEFSRFVSATDYKSDTIKTLTPLRIRNLQVEWTPNANQIWFEDTQPNTADLADVDITLQTKMKEKLEEIFDVLNEVYNSGDVNRAGVRFLATWVYYVAFALIAIPSILTFVCVVLAMKGLILS